MVVLLRSLLCGVGLPVDAFHPLLSWHCLCSCLVALEALDAFSYVCLVRSFLHEACEALLAAFQRLYIFPFSFVRVLWMLQLYPGRLMALLIQSRTWLAPFSGSAASFL